jgi:hypothetical protein
VEINWSVGGPIVLTVLANIAAFAYLFGVTKQQIQGVDRDVERIRIDVERLHEQNRDTDNRIHDMALMLTKISTQLDQIMGNPIVKAELVARKSQGVIVNVEKDTP